MNHLTPSDKEIIDKTTSAFTGLDSLTSKALKDLNMIFSSNQDVPNDIESWSDYCNEILIPLGRAFIVDWKWDPQDFFDAINRLGSNKIFTLIESSYPEYGNQKDTSLNIKYSIDNKHKYFRVDDYPNGLKDWQDELNSCLKNYGLFIVESNYEEVDDNHIYIIIPYEKAKQLIEVISASKNTKRKELYDLIQGNETTKIEPYKYDVRVTKKLDFNCPAEFVYGICVQFQYYDEAAPQNQATLQFINATDNTESIFSPLKGHVKVGETLREALDQHIRNDYKYLGPYVFLSYNPEYYKTYDYKTYANYTNPSDLNFRIKVVIPMAQKDKIRIVGYSCRWLTGYNIITTE